MIKRFIAIIFCIMSHVSFALPADNVEKSIKQLKFYVSQYSKHVSDAKWLQSFNYFMKTKIVESDKINQIALKSCLLRPIHFRDCITGSLGFYSTAVGIKNSLDFTLRNCQKTPQDTNCLLYQKMLQQNIAQMKYILRV